MNWFNILLTPNKHNEVKSTFGQPYLYASGYDDLRQEMHYTEKENIRGICQRNDLVISIGIAESFVDYHNICNSFEIRRFEFIKFIANKSNRMEEILKFLYSNIHGRTLICNIYMVTREATIDYHSKSKNVSRPITKILLGHHIVLCIPLTTTLSRYEEVKNGIKSLIKKQDFSFPDYFLSDSVALIDYTDIIEKPAFEILNELQDYLFERDISIFVEMPKLVKDTDFSNYAAESKALHAILTLKRLNYLMEEKFYLESNFICGKKPISMDDRDNIAETIIANVRQLGDLDVSSFPPPRIVVLYNHCKIYEREYLFALFDNCYLPALQLDLENNVSVAYRTIKRIPLKKEEDNWILKANDENANEIYQKYLSGKLSVLVTKNTKHLIADFCERNLVWVISEETKWQKSTEPVLIYNGNEEFLLGLAEPKTPKREARKNGEIFWSRCNCTADECHKAWICIKCNVLVRKIDETNIYCDCGVHKASSLKRKCFKCGLKEAEHDNNKTELLKKEPEFIEHEIKNKEMVEEKINTGDPKLYPNIVLAKKAFNILFIGQSGAGKSMLVNSIYNYLSYDFEAVSNAETVDCILPCQFQLQTPDFKKLVFKAGPEDENEYYNDNGQSVTQHPKVYKFETEKYCCKVIDTPGLGDTRGAKQDEYNLSLIRNAIVDIQELHAICFVMPSNISKLTANFEVHMRDLLSLFPKTAMKNIYFFFTYANSTFFTIGDTRNSLEEFITTFKGTNNAEIPFGMENVCCVDSEAFMYFIATKQGHKYQNRDLESFRISWDKSKEAIEKFLHKLREVESIKSDDILMTYEFEQIGLLLRKETNEKLEPIIQQILTKISQISMTSKFNTTKSDFVGTMEDFKKPQLFEALKICQTYASDMNLKQLIHKVIECYGQTDIKRTEEAPKPENGEPIGAKNEDQIKVLQQTEKTKNLANKNISHPEPPKRIQSNWPCIERLKKIAEKLANEWENGTISKNAMDDVFCVQIAGNQKLENIDKKKLKLSLDRLLMGVSNELAGEIEKFLENCFLKE